MSNITKRKSMNDIRNEYKSCAPEDLSDFIQTYGSDQRAGVLSIVQNAKKKLDKYNKELERLESIREFEKKYEEDYEYICGIDEVGRGPLAGPVVACAVILPKGCRIIGVDDSKKLSAAKREALYDEILDKAVAVGIGYVGPERIDEINILQATYEAMRQAVAALDPSPDLLLIDAVRIPELDVKQVPIIHGDARSISIGAASIVAKVTRDRLMDEMEEKYPGYSFAKNKGYGTQAHIEGLQKLGPCEIHRKTFITHFISVGEDSD